MNPVYVDASTALRIVLGEAGEKMPVAAGRGYYSSEVLEIETSRTLDRIRLTQQLSDDEIASKTQELNSFLCAVEMVPLSRDIVNLARSAFPISVRALDAIHVGTAQWLVAQIGEMEFWTHDRRQALAALSRALEVHGCPLT